MKLADDEVRLTEYFLLIKFSLSPAYLEEPMPSTPAPLSALDEETIICTPRKGAWAGGDEILMVIPKLDRRKGKKNEERNIE